MLPVNGAQTRRDKPVFQKIIDAVTLKRGAAREPAAGGPGGTPWMSDKDFDVPREKRPSLPVAHKPPTVLVRDHLAPDMLVLREEPQEVRDERNDALHEAATLFAFGDFVQAQEVLRQAAALDPREDMRLALLDLYRVTGQQAQYDEATAALGVRLAGLPGTPGVPACLVLQGEVQDLQGRLSSGPWDEAGLQEPLTVDCSNLVCIGFQACTDLLNWTLEQVASGHPVRLTGVNRLVAAFMAQLELHKVATIEPWALAREVCESA